jgi:MFS superfamily sulfate permease-like transporter
MKTVLLWLTFLLAILSGLFATLLPLHRLAEGANFIADETMRNMTGASAVLLMLPAIVVGVYAGDLVWLFFWRNLASRKDVEKVAFAGPTTRFDKWLTKKFGPQK